MRVHPLTRLVTVEESGLTIIEARIEFLDREGHVTKCHGQLRLDLYEAHDEIWAASHAQWNVDLRDADTNRTHFDDVTLTYVIKLRTAPDELPEQPVVKAFFFSSTGVKLEDRLRLRTE